MLNKAILIGNVGADPIFHTFPDGRENASFSLATTEKWTDKVTMEKKEKTEWHRIVVSVPSIVNIVKLYVRKGSKLYVEGAISSREWTDKEGVKKNTTQIAIGTAGRLLMLEGLNKGGTNTHSISGASTADKTMIENVVYLDDEMPF